MKKSDDRGRDGIVPASAASLEHLRVLVIDDDGYVRATTARLLQKLGIANIVEAADGLAGMRAMEMSSDGFDLTILDIDMPNSDGMEFLRLLGERNYAGALMILSGKPAPLLNSVRVMAVEHGLRVLSAAQKPLSVGLLQSVLSSCREPEELRRASTGSVYGLNEILSGLAKGEFEPFFQPKMEVATRRLTGCEALARWRHPHDGIVPPAAFIEAIENAKRIDELTDILLREAASWLHRWHDLGLKLTVSVNISMSSLLDNNIADRLAETVRGRGSDPRDFILEITETIAMTDVPSCLESLCRLRLRGFGLSIDDFGTGFSSLQQLTRVPYTELKIDREFVHGAAASIQRRAVLESSIELARKLGLTSVAEGVETEPDWELLRELGCQIAQGYIISKPLSGKEFTSWAIEADLRSRQTGKALEPRPDLATATILVVEDEPFQRRLVSSVLKREKIGRVFEAGSGTEALRLIGSEQIDVVIADIEMPEINGLELLRRVRSQQTGARRDCAFIILTSHSNPEVLGVAMALDVNGFVVKPFTIRVLLERITRTMRERTPLRSPDEYATVTTDLARLCIARDSGETTENAGAIDGSVSARNTVRIAELAPGMRTAENIVTGDGSVVIAAETILTQPLINLLSDLRGLLAVETVAVYSDI